MHPLLEGPGLYTSNFSFGLNKESLRPHAIRSLPIFDHVRYMSTNFNPFEGQMNFYQQSKLNLKQKIPIESAILITGAGGLIGSALIEQLKVHGYKNLILCRRELCDLRNRDAVNAFFIEVKPDVVFHTAAAVYGIGGNLVNRGSVFLDNILINTHVIEASRIAGVKKIIAMGTVAAYPDPKTIPVKEDQIWDGPPHGSESSYGHAKRAMLAQLLAYQENYGLDFAYIISTNLYGPNDKFDIHFGHVIPSLIRKFYEAKQCDSDVSIWGDGSAARDFLYSKDMGRALVSIMNHFTGSINVASGTKITIKDIAAMLADHYRMNDRIKWETDKPQGREFYEIDLSHLRAMGFSPSFSIREGLYETVNWFNEKYEQNLIRC